jgi:adenosylcobinamide-GDP ribazoletransferase
MVLSYLVLTGGFHMDGLMDTCDGHFSRRDLARRLEIMKDSRVGAFAVIGMVMLVLLKTGILMEIFDMNLPWWQIMTVPVLSRTLLLLLLKKAPYAKDEGLGKMYGDYAQKWDPGAWLVYAGVSALVIWLDPNMTWTAIAGVGLVFTYLWWSKKNFGGITGDLLGAFLEAAEAVLLLTLMLGGLR